MGKRGPKAAAELSVVVPLTDTRRPAPPEELTDEQKVVWREVVSSMPADWFTREHFALLATFSRHVIRERMLSHQIDAFKPEWVRAAGGAEKLDKLLSMAERETRAVMALARSMRLTHQARPASPLAVGRQ